MSSSSRPRDQKLSSAAAPAGNPLSVSSRPSLRLFSDSKGSKEISSSITATEQMLANIIEDIKKHFLALEPNYAEQLATLSMERFAQEHARNEYTLADTFENIFSELSPLSGAYLYIFTRFTELLAVFKLSKIFLITNEDVFENFTERLMEISDQLLKEFDKGTQRFKCSYCPNRAMSFFHMLKVFDRLSPGEVIDALNSKGKEMYALMKDLKHAAQGHIRFPSQREREEQLKKLEKAATEEERRKYDAIPDKKTEILKMNLREAQRNFREAQRELKESLEAVEKLEQKQREIKENIRNLSMQHKC